MAKFGKPADIGWAAVFLASEAAAYITGASLPVDGGNSIGF
jgi:NAD(P)-dependent dehydrogenase (short-subunit alcohol dehydrogenase family)